MDKEIATHSSILAWRIPWTEAPGGLQSIGSQSWTLLSTDSTHRLTITLFVPIIQIRNQELKSKAVCSSSYSWQMAGPGFKKPIISDAKAYSFQLCNIWARSPSNIVLRKVISERQSLEGG